MRKHSSLFVWIACFLLIAPFQGVLANLVQILHTNDTHSHLDHAIHRPWLGGYARLKSLIDEKKAWGTANGMGNLIMDGGDYLEGNIYYLSEKGKRTYEIYGSIGYDVSVIGNHDYLMGSRDLDELLGAVKPSFELLGANFFIDAKYKNVNRVIKPYTEMVINGVKVGIVGVTLNDVLYKWRIQEGGITSEVDAAKNYARILRERGNEVVILLSHAGLGKDKKIAKKVPDIDIIIGGHSHDETFQILWQKSKGGKKIAIVQAGQHAEWLGQLIFDYNKAKKSLKIAQFQLIPVTNKESDEQIADKIQDANLPLYDLFGEEWLNTVVGQSELRPIYRGGNPKIWHFFINDAMRETAKADFAINVSALSGSDFPVEGAITRRDLYNSNPRTFEFENKYGYNIHTAEVRGVWVSLVAKVAMRFGLPLYVSGLEFDYKQKGSGTWDDKYSISNLRTQGKKLKLTKNYKMGMCEAIVRGGYAITPWVRLLLKRPDNTQVSMWQSMEDHLKRYPVVKESYLEDHFGKTPGRAPASGNKIEHMYIPPRPR
ncbi:MAG: bifunctional metallophosphatase/5'-nucleotidase [Bdellovibrio sp.]|nr:bifunctional metallophosphatase/5'-nucleotidase [Bdellovibrio sp.]